MTMGEDACLHMFKKVRLQVTHLAGYCRQINYKMSRQMDRDSIYLYFHLNAVCSVG